MTSSLKDYIRVIYTLGEARDPVRLTDIAVQLNFTKASASRAIHTLCAEGLVTHERYGTLMLTEEGLHLAQEMQHRQGIFKTFLMEKLLLPEEIAEKDALSLEHSASPQMVAALEAFLYD